jgi:hypothetical protein
MPVKPEKVGIFITTNIDDKVHELTKSMIYNPLLKQTSRHYSKYPLTIKDNKFVYDELKSKTYEGIIDFFFDPILMAKTTTKTTDILTPKLPTINNIKLDTELGVLDTSMNADFTRKMSTSAIGTSVDLRDVSNVIVKLTDDLFKEYHIDLKNKMYEIETSASKASAAASSTASETSAEYNIIQMLSHNIKQPDFDKLPSTMKGKITKLKGDILSEINKIRHDVIAKLSKEDAIDKLTNLIVKKKHDQDIENVRLNTNINMMMYRLFPQTNLSASTFMSFLVRKIFPMHQTFKYSYLKIDGQTYTVVRYNWLNNIFNHPLYRKLFDGMVKYIEWTEEQTLYAQIYKDDTDGKITQIINSCSGDDIYNKVPFSDLEKEFKAKLASLNASPGNADLVSAINILLSLLTGLQTRKPISDILILLSQFSAYPEARKAINEIKIKSMREYIVKMLELNMIKEEVELYEERFFRGSNIDLKYDFPSRTVSKIDNEPIKRFQKLITDDFLPSQRTSTNYEFQSKFEDYLNNNGIEFIRYIQNMKLVMNSISKPAKDPDCKKCGYAIDEDIDINLNIVQGKEYKYEIYVHFDLIKGEVNDVNRGIMKCPYLNDTLVENWNNLQKNIIFPFWAPPKLPLFEVTIAETKKGGRRGTRYRRKKYNKTHKSRKTFSLEFLHL